MSKSPILPDGGRAFAKRASENPLPELCPFCGKAELTEHLPIDETGETAEMDEMVIHVKKNGGKPSDTRTFSCPNCAKKIVLRDKLSPDGRRL